MVVSIVFMELCMGLRDLVRMSPPPLELEFVCLGEQVPRPPLHINRQWGDIKCAGACHKIRFSFHG